MVSIRFYTSAMKNLYLISSQIPRYFVLNWDTSTCTWSRRQRRILYTIVLLKSVMSHDIFHPSDEQQRSELFLSFPLDAQVQSHVQTSTAVLQFFPVVLKKITPIVFSKHMSKTRRLPY